MPLFLIIFILYITYMQYITFKQYIHPSSFAEVPLHLLPGLPSRESNSGLPYSKPTHYQLSYTTPPDWATPRPNWATPHPN